MAVSKRRGNAMMMKVMNAATMATNERRGNATMMKVMNAAMMAMASKRRRNVTMTKAMGNAATTTTANENGRNAMMTNTMKMNFAKGTCAAVLSAVVCFTAASDALAAVYTLPAYKDAQASVESAQSESAAMDYLTTTVTSDVEQAAEGSEIRYTVTLKNTGDITILPVSISVADAPDGYTLTDFSVIWNEYIGLPIYYAQEIFDGDSCWMIRHDAHAWSVQAQDPLADGLYGGESLVIEATYVSEADVTEAAELAIVVSGTFYDPNTDEPAADPGDADLDGKVTAADALLILQSTVGLASLDDAQTEAADVDGDGEVTTADALGVLRAVVNMGA